MSNKLLKIIQKGASDKIAGATLEEYRSKINADAGDVGDEIAKALEELESAQTALDNTKQESVSQKNTILETYQILPISQMIG